MGKYAVVENDFVENVIVVADRNVGNMAQVLGKELVDAIPYGLMIGDFRNGGKWTRNLNGVQTILEEITPEQQTDYNGMMDVILEGEAALVEGVNSID